MNAIQSYSTTKDGLLISYALHTVNLATSLALNTFGSRPLRVGLLDLDIFGPSIPKLMGLESASEPELTQSTGPRPWFRVMLLTLLFVLLKPLAGLLPLCLGHRRVFVTTGQPWDTMHVYGVSNA